MVGPRLIILLVAAQLAWLRPGHAAFAHFESGHVRPLATAPDGRVLAVNTPDNRLAIFDPTPEGLRRVADVPVGLEPVAVAVRPDADGTLEAWVANHLSDTVSVVAIDAAAPARSFVRRTIHVGDEPRDIVIAGTRGDRVFVTTAHRGHARPTDPQFTTPGVGRADVWVFDAGTVAGTPDPPPLTIVELFGDTPRALARSPDGALVYAAVFQSGNQTTTITERVVAANGGLPPPPADSPWRRRGFPSTGLIVTFDPASGGWLDERGRDWRPFVPFSLPDWDVFAIDADAEPPRPARAIAPVAGVGTVLYGMAVRPDTGAVYVSNTEARNAIRFEPMLRGHATENRISVVTGGRARPVHLNPHIDYAVTPGSPEEIARSLAVPTGLAFSGDGRRLYVAAMGSGVVAELDSDALASGQVAGRHMAVGAGPTGVALDEARDRLYVMNRIDHTLSVVDLGTGRAEATVSVGFDPTPAAVREGRRFLYDARTTSAHGDQACASCHVFGDLDSLAWDLGDPYGQRQPNRNRFETRRRIGFPPGRPKPFHPMKGPMTTQSLRGLDGAGPMHWRGDRSVRREANDGSFDEARAFERFNQTFVTLLGRPRKLRRAEMRMLADFVLALEYPPNPIQTETLLGLRPEPERRGVEFFGAAASTRGASTCSTCHGSVSTRPDGFIGTNARSVLPPFPSPQQFKVPHLRNLYQKVGMFDVPGPQIRGFGFLHDGSIPTIARFLRTGPFVIPDDATVDAVQSFLLAFGTGFHPLVGRQAALEDARAGRHGAIPRGEEIDLVAKMVRDGEQRGFLYVPQGDLFQPDRRAEASLRYLDLVEIVRTTRQPLVFTAVPLGSGERIGVDRDADGVWDGDERDAGTDPGDPASHP